MIVLLRQRVCRVRILAVCLPALLGVLLGGCRTTKDGAGSQPQSATSEPKAKALGLGAGDTSGGEPRAEAPPPSGVDPTPREGPAPKRTYRVAALGDSITDESVGGGGYLKFLRQACPASEFVDFGKGGDMTNQMRRRLNKDLLAAHSRAPFDTLIVYGGVNDLYSDLSAGRNNDKIEQDLSTIYAQGKEHGMRIVAVTVSPWGGFSRYFNERRGRNTRLLNSWILGGPDVGRVDVVVDSYPLLSCGSPEKLCRDYQGPRPDGLHPGKRGHEILGQAILEKAFPDCR